MTRRVAVAAAALAVAGAAVPAAARSPAAPRVSVMVVGPHGTLLAPHTVRARATRLRVGGHRCRIGAATGLAALAGARRAGGPALAITDDGACSPGALFVTKIGRFANHGAQGWSFKVGTSAPSRGAGTRTGLRAGARILWFWCRLGAHGCQRTLAVAASPAPVAPAGPVAVRVRAYDDRGRGRAAEGALVRLGGATARTDAGGHATLTAPAAPGTYRLTAASAGLVPAYPESVRVR